MKNRFVLFLMLTILLQGCRSVEWAARKQQKALQVKTMVEAFDFTFEALTAHSMSFHQIQLSPNYTLDVSQDTLKANLPFFGQAYVAPMNSTEGGIKFTSSNFLRKLIYGKKVGNWKVKLKTLDTHLPVELFIDIWDNGTAHLVVNDANRQVMSFDGFIR